MNEREESESVLLYHCPTCGATHLDPVEDTETAALRDELAEAKRDMHSFQVQLKSFEKFYWELVDLFDKDAGGVSPLHYVKKRIAEMKDANAALVTDSAELRAELAEKKAEVEQRIAECRQKAIGHLRVCVRD